MLTIYKYDAPSPGTIRYIDLPQGAKIIRFGIQEREYFLWAIVETNNPTEEREFKTVATGRPLQETDIYFGTLEEDRFIWHLFEIKQEK